MIDHPTAATLIQDECTICHMPMMRYESKLAGGEGEAVRAPPAGPGQARPTALADDGVSCTVCHQITGQSGQRARVSSAASRSTRRRAPGERHEYGPYRDRHGPHDDHADRRRTFQPTEGKHIHSSELCATCHTLFTKALDAAGQGDRRTARAGSLSGMAAQRLQGQRRAASPATCRWCRRTCRSPRCSASRAPGFRGTRFVGGNFFMQRLLNRYRDDLGIAALPAEMDAAANRTIAHLQIGGRQDRDYRPGSFATGRVEAEISVENLGGHKLPTAIPVAPRVAARDGARPQRHARFSSRARSIPTARSRATTTTTTRALRAALHRDHATPTRCRSTSR